MFSRRALLAVSCLAFVGGAAPAEAVQGTIAITGTEGRDDVSITFTAAGSGSPGVDEVVIFPFVALSAPARAPAEGPPPTICEPIRDVLTARSIGHRCARRSGDRLTWQVDLRGGSDALSMSMGDQNSFDGYTAAGGAGDDSLVVAGLAPRSLSGGDGDDVLSAPQLADDPDVVFDGGKGRDLVDYRTSRGLVAGGEPGGVTASLATGRADLLIGRRTGQPDIVRTDQLTSIERISGTPFGDVLTGGRGPDELLGQEGPDEINGGDGDDALNGGNGEDRLDGGPGADSIDGGAGIDEFAKGSGGDTFLMRDGFIERVGCSEKDVVVNDLVDVVVDPSNCLSISTAQAKHRFDTRLSRRVALSRRTAVSARVSCPATKTEACVGTLRLRLRGSSGPVLARARYRVRVGRADRLSLRLSAREARRARGSRITLDAAETDADGRARRVTAATRLRR